MSTPTTDADLKAAYAYCGTIARRQARNFYYAFVTLPRAKRQAVYAIYAFSRAADDIADGDGPTEAKAEELTRLRNSLSQALDGNPEGPVLTALADAARAHGVPGKLFHDIIDGVEMDLTIRRYETFNDLREYCLRVASAVGLVSIYVFGHDGEHAEDYAIDFGLAMQLTNILRDLREDIERDRVYLPQEELRKFGYSDDKLRAGVMDEGFIELMRFQTERAREYFRSGARLLPLLEARSRPCAAGLHELYSRLLDRIEARGFDVFSGRVHLPDVRKTPDDLPLVGNQLHPRTQLGTVAVLGGGLAGMAAAWRLTELGYAVTLVERRPYLGGRAYSFVDRETGVEVDNGQHVFLGCCTAYTRFLQDVGTLRLTYRQPRLQIEVRWPNGRTGVLKALPLPAPFHLLTSFFAYPHLSWREKLRAARALLAIWRERDPERRALREQSFLDWLRRKGQSKHAVANFWDLFIVPALNDASKDVSASMGFMVFQQALLKDRHGADVGFARAGLSEIMGSAIGKALEKRGVALLLGRTVQAITVDKEKAGPITLAGGETLEADWYVSALPPAALLEALPSEVASAEPFAAASSHTWSPIVNLHIWYDRPIGDFEFLAFVDSPVQWVFNRTRIAGLHGPGQYVTVSLSAAWEFWPLSKEELRTRLLPELARLFPGAAGARVERFVVVKEQRATFRTLPGGPDNRLPSTTPIANFFLAGDWTDTGWPATMEGAVRSGESAAQTVHFHSVHSKNRGTEPGE